MGSAIADGRRTGSTSPSRRPPRRRRTIPWACSWTRTWPWPTPSTPCMYPGNGGAPPSSSLAGVRLPARVNDRLAEYPSCLSTLCFSAMDAGSW
uniref:Uncharacterized protein n=1 Tax=Oryza meridionalis TaxID=40149 RepID=A0A0E0CM72_9ORYZ